MKTKLSGFIGIISVLMLFAWTPAASAASWSTGICNPPPTYGPYSVSGATKYYCPAAGSLRFTTTLTGGIASEIMSCTDPETCGASLTDAYKLATDAEGGPNVVFQCKVPGAKKCTGKECGGSPDSGSPVFGSIVLAEQSTSPLTSASCTRNNANKQIKCSEDNSFSVLEGNAELTSQFCPAGTWVIEKSYALRFFATNFVNTSAGTTLQTYHYCELLDPEGREPGEEGYSPDLQNPSNNSYACEDVSTIPE
jgi:hypothetical protein